MIRQDQSSWSIIRTMCQCLISSNDSASVSIIDSTIISSGYASTESFVLTIMFSIA